MNKKKLAFISFLFSLNSAFAFVPGADRYELSIGGDVPFYTGIQARYNWSTRYYTKLGAGFALEWFMQTHRKFLNELGVSKQTELFTSALANSVVFDARMGWAMSIYEGPYVELGYSFMLWGRGEVTGREINNTINSNSDLSDDSNYQVNIRNHGPALHIGYRFILIDKLTLNMDFGVYKPLFSTTALNYGDVSVPSGDSEAINDLLIRQIWFLSLGVWFGLVF